MKFSLSKLKKPFGTSETKANPQEQNYTDDLIKSLEHKPFAMSSDNVCYASANELAGYYYLQTMILGKFKIKTFDGAQLKVLGTDVELTLESDMMELESEIYTIPKSYLTRMDFILNEKDLPKIGRSQIHTLIFTAKKQNLEFSVIPSEDMEEVIKSNTEQSD